MRRQGDLGPQEPGRRDERREPPAPQRAGVAPRRVLIGLSAIVLVAFAVANFRTVQVSFLLFTTQARVVTVIVVAAALGFVIGYFVGRPGRAERRALRELRDRD